MRLGLQVPNFTWPENEVGLGERFGLIAERAERAGLYSLWVMDHFFQIPKVGNTEEPMLEGWSALAYAAARTNRIRLGTLVTGVTYRHPGILVKTATTLDVLSSGRAYLGIGAAWNVEEHEGLGVAFPSVPERLTRLEEALQIVHQMWSGDESPYQGEYYQLGRPLNSPQPVQKPHPPILIGGSGERRTLKLVAKYADACNLFLAVGPDELTRKLEVLKDHCQAVGRPYEEIEKTGLATLHLTRDGRDGSMTPSDVLDFLRDVASIGIQHTIFNMPNVADSEPFEILRDEIVPIANGMSV